MLNDDEIERFHRTGFLVLEGVFRGRELDALREAADAVQHDALAGRGSGHRFRDVAGTPRYWRTDGVWDSHPAFRAATANPALLTAVGQCLGHPFLPVNDTLVVKLPHAGAPVDWHQDAPYGGPDGRAATFGVPNFDCDIYLDSATVGNGCLYGLPGHHLSGHVELEHRNADLFDHPDVIPLEMAPGDVLLHAITAPHGSKANHSAERRRVFYVHYLAREVAEALHPEWARAFTGDGVQRMAGFRAERERLGWDTGGPVELTAGGLAFHGEPGTPRQHWQRLIDDLGDAQVRARKTLTRATG